MAQVLIPTSNGNPIQFVPDGFPVNGAWPNLVITAVPPGSKMLGQSLGRKGGQQHAWEPPDTPRYYELTPDAAGVWTFQYVAASGQAQTLSLEVATKLTRTLSASFLRSGTTVAIYVGNGVVVGTPTISADTSDAIAIRAVTAAGVVSALSALVGMSPAQISATGWPELETAYATACSSPPSLPNESSVVGTLIAAGWSKS